jgi:EAL domain-containing protein (putative c-di-GMP-specific phosphodiesterase class I)
LGAKGCRARLLRDHRERDAIDRAGLETIERLHALGIGFSVDDFGMGFSSLAYLKQLPIESLKIDRSFVAGMTTNVRDASIVRSTINLAHDLGLKVVAEGVETGDALAMIARLGCDEAQGYFIARPQGGAALAEWLRRGGWGAGSAPI